MILVNLFLKFNARIVSEGSVQRFRRSLLETTAAPEENSTSTTNVTLEFGDPPAPNITMTSAPSVVEEIELAREVNDSVDVTVCAVGGNYSYRMDMWQLADHFRYLLMELCCLQVFPSAFGQEKGSSYVGGETRRVQQVGGDRHS